MSSRRIAHALFFAAIVLSPLGVRMPVGPAAASPADVAMGLAAMCFSSSVVSAGWVSFLQRLRTLRATLPLMAVSGLSALAAGNLLGNAADIVQIALYAGAGVWVGASAAAEPGGTMRLGKMCAAACLIAGAGLGLEAFGVANANELFGVGAPLACAALFFATLYVAAMPRPRGLRSAFGRTAAMAGALCALLVAPAGPPADSTPVAQLQSPIGQRYLEAFAACGVVAHRPLFGLGPGNYQARIGEYYGVLPKSNTMAPGTQVGYAVVLASMGLLGLAALLRWFFTLFVWVRATRPPDARLLFPLIIVAAAGLYTPLFVTQLLAPLAALHALVWARYTGLCSD